MKNRRTSILLDEYFHLKSGLNLVKHPMLHPNNILSVVTILGLPQCQSAEGQSRLEYCD